MSVCFRFAGDRNEAGEILQSGFIRVFENIHQFKGKGSLEGWIRRVIVNVAARHMSKKKISFTEITDAQEEDIFVDPVATGKISADEIHAYIRSLPEGYRLVFNLNVIEGYSHEEIAEILGIQPVTSRTQLLKARKMLQEIILKQYNAIAV